MNFYAKKRNICQCRHVVIKKNKNIKVAVENVIFANVISKKLEKTI